MLRIFWLSLLSLWGLAMPQNAVAIPPPDVLFTLSSSFLQIFTIIIALGGALFGSLLAYFKPTLRYLKARWLAVFLGVITLVAGLMITFEITNKIEALKFDQLIRSQLEATLPGPAGPEAAPTVSIPATPEVPLMVSNVEFAKLLADDPDIYVLDAREDEENALGALPGSVHIRAGDLLAGDYHQLPSGQTIYVLCWSGIRGELVATELRQLGMAARYLEEGATGWVEFGGAWTGQINFREHYTDPQYKKLFTTSEVQTLVDQGTLLLDVRSADHRRRSPVAEAVYFPLLSATSSDIASQLIALPIGEDYLVICDEYVNCFEATILGVKLTQAGHNFLGRYAAPWEWPR